MKNVYCACYNTLHIFASKENARKFFTECFYASEGSEHERYSNILVDLMYSDIGTDRDSFSVWEIRYHNDNNEVIRIDKIERENTNKVIERLEKEC